MAKAVADTLSPGENAAGYVSDDGPITGFSQLHDSGTGGVSSLVSHFLPGHEQHVGLQYNSLHHLETFLFLFILVVMAITTPTAATACLLGPFFASKILWLLPLAISRLTYRTEFAPR